MGGNLGKCDKREVGSGQTRKGGDWPTGKDKRGRGDTIGANKRPLGDS
jgi:hypothetical protein